VFQRGNKWWIAFYANGKEIRKSVGKTREDAERVLAGGSMPTAPLTVNQLLDGLIADYQANGAKSLDTTLSHARAMRDALGVWPTTRITREVLVGVRDTWLAGGVAPATINRRFATLSRGWRLAGISPVPRWPTVTERNARTGFFEREEVERLVPFLPAYLRPVVWFAFYTGWRRGEIMALSWHEVDLPGKVIRLGDTKSGYGRVLALEGAVWDILCYQERLGCFRALHTDAVFPGPNGHLRDFKEAWKKARAKAGLEGKLFHDLRRTAVRNMLRAGVPERVAMEITGHRTRKVFDRYNIVDERDIREAMRRITSV
jgi:integrase